jgi:amino acid adenylation domain-containing protein
MSEVSDGWLIRQFDGLVASQPDAVAIVDGAEHYTYREVARLSNYLAGRLILEGVRHDDFIALVMVRSASMIIAVLAVLKSGAAYVPLDPHEPVPRLREMLSRLGCRLLITAEFSLPFISTDCRVLYVGGRPAADMDIVDRCPVPLPNGAAYVLFTSGSTGSPKGVVVTRRALENHMAWMLAAFGFDRSVRVALKTPMTFDACVWEVFAPLLAGGLMIIAKPLGERDPMYLRALLAEHAVTTLQMVPALLEACLFAGVFHELRGLEAVFVGGDRLQSSVVRKFAVTTRATLHNLYGPTEATIDSTSALVSPASDIASGDIGMAITNVRVHVVDAQLEPVPTGVEGEFLITGAGLARGYHADPAATADCFRPDSHGPGFGERAYRTGDFGHRLADLRLIFCGRRDDLVKVRGHRVNLGEIQAKLLLQPGVAEAAVISREVQGDAHIVAYVALLRGATDIGSDALRRNLAERLPDYMLPSRIVLLHALPKAKSGKIDRRALPTPPALSGESSAIPLHGEAEELLAGVWMNVLRCGSVGSEDNFFRLGGDSIKSIRVVALARQRGLEISVEDVFLHPTIRGLASGRVVRPAASGRTEASAAFALISGADRAKLEPDLEDAYPLSSIQKALYFLSQTSLRYEVYVTSFELRAAYSEQALIETLAILAARHPWLRTSVDVGRFSEPMQLVHKQARIPLEVEDLSGLPAAEQRPSVIDWVERQRTQRCDWNSGSFLKVHVHLRGPQHFQLSLVEPIFDGWSLSLLVAELLTTYGALVRGVKPEARPPGRLAYREFIRLEREACQSESCARHWLQMLEGWRATQLPRVSGIQHMPKGAVLRQIVDIPRPVSDALRALSAESAIPLKSLLFAVHTRVIGGVCGTHQVMSGMMVNGRPEVSGGDQVLGIFLNTIPLKLDLETGSWLSLATRAFEAERAELAYRRYPFALMQLKSGIQPLFEVIFNFTHFHVLENRAQEAGIEVVDTIAWDQTFFPFVAQFQLDVFSGCLKLALDYDALEFAPIQVQTWAAYYERALTELALRPDADHRLSFASDEENVRRRVDGGGPAVLAEILPSLSELLSRFATLSPDAIALSFEEEQLSYRELGRRVNDLAHVLSQHGARAEQRIGVCVERGPSLVVAILAVLQTGAAYVPIDPLLPPKRLAYVLADSDPALVVCDKQSSALLPDATPRILVTVNIGFRDDLVDSRVKGDLPQSLAYILYTSGSSGRPKGVQISRGALENFLNGIVMAVGLRQCDTVFASTPISFDIAVLELLAPLSVGARLVITSRAVLADAFMLVREVSLRGTTVLQGTPSNFQVLLDAGFRPRAGMKLLCGGESLSRKLADSLLGENELYNLYGPTETTIWSSFGPVEPAPAGVHLGKPLLNTQIYLLDRWLEWAPLLAAEGELYIAGNGLSRGYWRGADSTAERFLPDSISRTHGGRMYRTGDLATGLPSSRIRFSRRNDTQLKIRGQRVEPSEIEACIAVFPGIRSTVVHMQPTPAGARLCAYLVLDDGRRAPTAELKDYLRQRLPEQMIPSHYVVIDRIPLTFNGKLDQTRLPLPEVPLARDERLTRLLAEVECMSDGEAEEALANERRRTIGDAPFTEQKG